MFNLIILIVLFSFLFGNREGANRMLQGLLIMMAVIYGGGFLLAAGIRVLPMILLIMLVTKVCVPFVKGFMSSFRKSR